MSCDLTIIVVSFNTRDMTLACLHSIYEQTFALSFEVLVVDNASRDGSADAIEEHFGNRLTLIRSAANLGFAAANNLAARRATGRRILLLNPDTIVLDRAIERLAAFANAHEGHGIYGGRTVFADGTLNPGSCWRCMSLWSLFCRACGLSALFRSHPLFNTEAYAGWERDSIRPVDIVTGCFHLIERTLWERLGGFDEHFFMYGEEADLCIRARAAGARPIVTPEATIIHHGGASEPVRDEKVIRLLRAKVELIRRHWRLTAPLGVLLIRLDAVARRIVFGGAASVASARYRAQAQCWRSVWNRRHEWLSTHSRRRLGAPSVRTRRGRRALRVVLYHHVSDRLPEETRLLNITTPLSTFERHIAHYAADYDVVDLDVVLTDELPPRPLLLTFDDCYRSVLDVAAPILRERRVPGVAFINPGPIASGTLPLDNCLSLVASRYGLDALASALLDWCPSARHMRRADLTFAWLIQSVLPRMPLATRLDLPHRLQERFSFDLGASFRDSRLFLEPSDIVALTALGVEIGNHTMWHTHTRALAADDLEHELVRPQRILAGWAHAPVRAFSYPYGQPADVTACVAQTLRASGHRAQFLVGGRLNALPATTDTWHRVSFSDQHNAFCRLEVLPRVRALVADLRRRQLDVTTLVPRH